MRRTLKPLPLLVVEGAKRHIHPKQIYRHNRAFVLVDFTASNLPGSTAAAIPATNSKNSSHTPPYLRSRLPFGCTPSVNHSAAMSRLLVNPLQ